MYSPEQLEQILNEKDSVIPRVALVMGKYLSLSARLPKKSQEHCQYGVCRRLLIIHECLEHFFSEIPPDSNKERTREEQARANIHLHAFLINVSGIIDNIAWLWAYAIGLENQIDLEKKKKMVGLFSKDFAEYLPDKLTDLVEKYAEWYSFMVSHRHPTAHRIPPYMIPYTVKNENDPPSSRNYTPRYIHSFNSHYGPIPLHVQALADTNTILSLLDSMLLELNKKLA